MSRLKVAWVFHTGDISGDSHDRRRSGFEATPILVDGMLCFATGFSRVFALDPETGKQRWAYDPLGIDPKEYEKICWEAEKLGLLRADRSKAGTVVYRIVPGLKRSVDKILFSN